MKSSLLNQYVDLCRDALRVSNAKINKRMHDLLIEILLLFIVIPRKVNFLRLGRLSDSCEQRFRQNFDRPVDWLGFNLALCNKVFGSTAGKAIVIDPCFIPKSGTRTPWVDNFYSGTAGKPSHGLEILGIGLLDAGSKEYLTLEAVQTPDRITLDRYDVRLVEWYLSALRVRKDKLAQLSRHVVADAYFAKAKFVNGLESIGFELVSCLRDDANMRYIADGSVIGAGRGRKPKYYGKVNIDEPDMRYFQRIDSPHGRLLTAIVNIPKWKRDVRVVIFSQKSGEHKLFFSTDTMLSAIEIVAYYRGRFQIEFSFRDAKQYASLCSSQARDIRRLDFHFNASFTAVNLCRVMSLTAHSKYSISALKMAMHDEYTINRFIRISGLRPNKRILNKYIKELYLQATTVA